MKITFEKLIDEEQNILVTNIINEINLKNFIEKHKINNELKDLLMNCGKEEMQGLIIFFSIEVKKIKIQ